MSSPRGYKRLYKTSLKAIINDGIGSNTFKNANLVNDLSIINQNLLKRATITTFDASNVGLELIVYMTASMEAGDSTVSARSTIVL